jgi:anti-sigma factor RsiW
MMPTDAASDMPSMMDCEVAARALYDYLDGRLPDATQQAVRQHVEVCGKCAPHFQFSRRVLELMPAALPLSDESDALRLKVIESLKAEGFSAPG